MTREQIIPLDLLVPSRANVRRTGRTEGIGELAASIAAHGLRQNLNVQPTDDERFEVVAGGRRLRALRLLVKSGKLAADMPVSCLVLQDGESAEEISLAENTLRTAMHPDDQCEAFRTLIETKGSSIEEVGARFGVTASVVRQRLKLASVSPKLRTLFRKGEMDLDHVMAFTNSDDHEAQEAVWNSLPEWNRDPSSIKDALTNESVAISDRLAQFVGVETYVEAGGDVLRDLFDDSNAGYLADRSLVMKLAEARLEREAEAVRTEGWKWVRTEINRDYSVAYDRLPPGKVSAKNKARARRHAETGEAGPAVAGYSAALIEDLTAHRTAALRIELVRSPAIALAVTVHMLACQLLCRTSGCLALRAESKPLDRHISVMEDSPAHKAMAEEGERWGGCPATTTTSWHGALPSRRTSCSTCWPISRR